MIGKRRGRVVTFDIRTDAGHFFFKSLNGSLSLSLLEGFITLAAMTDACALPRLNILVFHISENLPRLSIFGVFLMAEMHIQQPLRP